MITLRNVLRSVAVSALLASSALAQTSAAPVVTFPDQSPAAKFTQDVGLSKIEVDYFRPGVKGRKIFGPAGVGTEAFGRVWRTGANNATKITFSTPVKFGGVAVPAGTYALFSIPDANEWTVILNQVVGQWGAYNYKEANDVARVKVQPVRLAQPVETFTIDVNDIRDQSATLNLVWENTRVAVPLEVDVASTLVPQIEQLMASGAKVSNQQYFKAAVFYVENGLDLNKARTWIEAATNNDKPAFYMMHWRAKILAKLGDKEGARAAAEKSSKLAVAAEGPLSPFLKMNADLVASLK